jgi:hypothetical protein
MLNMFTAVYESIISNKIVYCSEMLIDFQSRAQQRNYDTKSDVIQNVPQGWCILKLELLKDMAFFPIFIWVPLSYIWILLATVL